MADVAASEVDAIVYATSTPDHFAPGNGVFLQRAMGIGTIPALDIRTQCSGFVYALSVADGWIRTGQYRRVLVVGAEVQSTGMLMTSEGRHVSVIFADGAGAALLGPTDREDRGILAFDLHSEGAHAEKLWVDSPGSMYHPRVSAEHIEAGRQLSRDGRQGGLPPRGGRGCPSRSAPCSTAIGRSAADLKLLLAHQANLRISRDDAARSLPAGRPGLQQHHVVRQHHRGHDPDRAGRVRARGAGAGRGPGGDDGVRVGFLWGSAAVVW